MLDLKRIHNIVRAYLVNEYLSQDKAVRSILEEHVKEIEDLLYRGQFSTDVGQITMLLDGLTDQLYKQLEEVMDRAIFVGVTSGTIEYKTIIEYVAVEAGMNARPISKVIRQANNKAVDAALKKQTAGLTLSERIWTTSKTVNESLGAIVVDALKEGDHPRDIAKKMQRYVQADAKTLVVEYPNMMERIGDMLPDDLSYEALRLARTEMASAYGEAEIRTAEEAPYSEGIKWELSNAGVACQTCRDNAERITDLGVGSYRTDELPTYPAHPNCMCKLTHIVEDLQDFSKRMKEWVDGVPHPDIEKWYKEVYSQMEEYS